MAVIYLLNLSSVETLTAAAVLLVPAYPLILLD